MNNKDFSTAEIIERALNEKDDAQRWSLVTVLHWRGTEEVLEAAVSLCQSGEPRKIELGADILGQLGVNRLKTLLPFETESLPVLLQLADSELKLSKNGDDLNALQSVVIALGRMEDKKSRKKIAEFKNLPSVMIRKGVAVGLSFVEDDFAVEALLELSGDSDKDVRNWATFGLGQSEADSEEIRDALLLRLNEDESDIGREICGEALVGLARRKDERVVEPLLNELAGDSVGTLAVEAAFEIADQRFCKPLLQLKDWWDVDKSLLKEAIESCCGVKSKSS